MTKLKALKPDMQIRHTAYNPKNGDIHQTTLHNLSELDNFLQGAFQLGATKTEITYPNWNSLYDLNS